jgi:hypothetical protein
MQVSELATNKEEKLVLRGKEKKERILAVD